MSELTFADIDSEFKSIEPGSLSDDALIAKLTSLRNAWCANVPKEMSLNDALCAHGVLLQAIEDKILDARIRVHFAAEPVAEVHTSGFQALHEVIAERNAEQQQ